MAEIYSTGDNGAGQLGLGDTTDRNEFEQVGILDTWKKITVGYQWVLALDEDGTIWAWGDDTYGTLGGGGNSSVPVQIGTGSDWVDIASTNETAFAIKSDGTLYSWGYNSNYGMLGQGSFDVGYLYSPTQIGTDTDWESVCGDRGYHAFAIKSDGSLYAWGRNNNGQLGLGDTDNRNTPTQVGTDTDWEEVAKGDYFSVARKSDNTIYSCGLNDWGQLGQGTYGGSYYSFTQIGSSYWKAVGCGGNWTFAVQTGGTLYGTGRNSFDQMGLPNSYYNTLTQIGSDSDWEYATGGYQHSMGLKNDGSVYAVGENSQGELGLGDTTSRSSWTEVALIVEIGHIDLGVSDDGGFSIIITPYVVPGIVWGPPSTPSGIDTLSGGDIYITAVTLSGSTPWAACMPSFWMSGVSIAYNWLIHTGVAGEYFPLNYGNLTAYLYGRYDSNKHLVRVTSGESWTAEELLTGDFGATEKFVSMREVAVADTDLYFHITKYGGTEGKIYKYDGVLTDRATTPFQPSVGYTMTDDDGILTDYIGCSGTQAGPIRKYNAVDGWVEQTGLPETAITDIEGCYY